jgi:hypothetical protein
MLPLEVMESLEMVAVVLAVQRALSQVLVHSPQEKLV